MSIDLNIGVNVLSHLSIEDAIKEIMANAYDEHIMNNITKDVKIYKENNTWIIKDFGTGLTEKHFIVQENQNKIDRNDVIGWYGFGLKDSLGKLNSQNIEVQIITKKKIFTPNLVERENTNDKTLHISIVKNTTIEIEDNCGTEFRFKNLRKSVIDKAKNMFINFLNPSILYSNHNIQIFKLLSQNIYINGVQIYNNTGFHFSYNLKRTKNIQSAINRDRKSIDIKMISKEIQLHLKKIIFNYDQLNTLTKDIIKLDSVKKLQEFNNKDVLRNVISQYNNLDKFVFIDKSDIDLSKYKQQINNCGCEPFILGNSIKYKFNIKNIRDLNYNYNFYKSSPDIDDMKNIHTLFAHIAIKEQKQEIIRSKISRMLEELQSRITITDTIITKLLDINVDDNLQENDYNFDGKTLLISSSITDNILKGVIIHYIINNIEQEYKIILYEKLGDAFTTKTNNTNTKAWFNFW